MSTIINTIASAVVGLATGVIVTDGAHKTHTTYAEPVKTIQIPQPTIILDASAAGRNRGKFGTQESKRKQLRQNPSFARSKKCTTKIK